MKRVVSVSLGSKRGDKSVTTEFLGEPFELSREAVPDIDAGCERIRALDGTLDAIGLGGIDRYLYAGRQRYTLRDGDRMARCATKTPVVDGSGIKNTLERQTIQWVQDEGVVDLAESRVFLVCAVDRFGMAEALEQRAHEVIYGDLMFALGLPVPLRSHRAVIAFGRVVLPVVTQLPFTWFYPTGEQQEKIVPKFEPYFRWADVIAGDSKYIFRNMPTPESGALAGKTIITQTLTPADLENLKARGVKRVVTSTREFDGRTFATNVVEGILVALAGKRPEEMRAEDYTEWLQRLEWRPTVRDL
jgi:hypothetical protein